MWHRRICSLISPRCIDAWSRKLRSLAVPQLNQAPWFLDITRFSRFWCYASVIPASGGPTRFVKTLKQCHVSELDSLPQQAQSFQLDTHEDKRSRIWITRKEKKKIPTCNASASTNEGERDRHPAVRTRAEARQRRKTKDERRKHHAVRTHKYDQPGLEPGHCDTSAAWFLFFFCPG